MATYSRRSSRGNPYHDERGRFCSRDKATGAYVNGVSVSLEAYDKLMAKEYKGYYDDRYYDVRTAQRKRAANPPPEVNAYVIDGDNVKTVFGNEVQEGMIVEYDPAWAEPGQEEAEAKYLFVTKNMRVNEKGKGSIDIVCLNGESFLGSIQRVDIESIRPASTEKVDATDAAMTRDERERMARISGWHKGIRDVNGAADYLSKQEYVESVKLKGANVVEFEYAGMKQSGYLHVEDGTAYFKPTGGDRYVTVDRYVSTQEYEMRYDYIINYVETNDFTEITGSIGGDVERVRIHNDGSVGAK